MTYEIKDSGERREFITGSVRDKATGKGRYDLVSPIALRRLAQHYERGAQKYADRNWEKGQPLSVFLDSGIRHLQDFLEGQRDEDHLAAAAWNVFAAIHIEHEINREALPAELNDLPNYVSALKLDRQVSDTPTPQFAEDTHVRITASGPLYDRLAKVVSGPDELGLYEVVDDSGSFYFFYACHLERVGGQS